MGKFYKRVSFTGVQVTPPKADFGQVCNRLPRKKKTSPGKQDVNWSALQAMETDDEDDEEKDPSFLLEDVGDMEVDE